MTRLPGSPPSFLTLAKRSFWLWFGGVWFAVGVATLLAGAGLGLRELRLKREGVAARGVVLSKEVHREGSGGQRRSEFRVRYRFTAGGRVVEGADEVDVERWAALEEGEPIGVEYARGAPGSNRLAGASETAGALVTLGFGVVFTPVGGFLLLRELRRIRTWRRLLREGMPTEGTVRAVTEANVRFNNRTLWKVRYHYRDPRGQECEGESGHLSREAAAAWKVGDPVAVRFDPRRPQDSVWAEDP